MSELEDLMRAWIARGLSLFYNFRGKATPTAVTTSSRVFNLDHLVAMASTVENIVGQSMRKSGSCVGIVKGTDGADMTHAFDKK